MAKSLEQLQVELSKADDQARKPYDLLHGVSGTGGLERDYNIAIRDKDAEKIARLKPIFEKAQADYKAAQEKKNAINKEIKAIFNFEYANTPLQLSKFNSSLIHSENLSRHDKITSKIFIPPPDQV